MTKRTVKVKIEKDGTFRINNAGNSDEARILRELSELAAILSGDKAAFEIEAHVHTHATAHTHADGTIHTHG